MERIGLGKIKAIRKKVGENVEFFELENELSALQEVVGGYIEAVSLPNGIVLWCNEEGLLEGLPQNLILLGDRSVPIVGDALFTSADVKGETIGLNELQMVWIVNRMKIIGKSKYDGVEYFVYGLDCSE
jgi:hypothetical protein